VHEKSEGKDRKSSAGVSAFATSICQVLAGIIRLAARAGRAFAQWVDEI
jgi:hypothetical protein